MISKFPPPGPSYWWLADGVLNSPSLRLAEIGRNHLRQRREWNPRTGREGFCATPNAQARLSSLNILSFLHGETPFLPNRNH